MPLGDASSSGARRSADVGNTGAVAGHYEGMSHSDSTDATATATATAAFSRCWGADAPRVAAYARRHVPPDEVPDVVAETFLQAWRRWADLPEPPIPWLIGTARKVIGNQRRAAGRRAALHERLVLLDGAAATADDAGLVATERMAALESLAALPDDQREALLLTAWDGLSNDDAAAVLSIRPGALRVRAHRARRTLDGAPSVPPTLSSRALTEGGLR